MLLGYLQVRAENEEGKVQRERTDAERSKAGGWQAGMKWRGPGFGLEWRGPGFGLEGGRKVKRRQKCGGGLRERGVGRRTKRDTGGGTFWSRV